MPLSPQIEKGRGDVLSVAVIGNDTVLAALPAHPVQLAHGCHLLGYHTVVPASWGDELVADAVLRLAETRGRQPAIVCACELARARLTTSTGSLQPFLISTISPPVAAARHLRALLVGRRLDITFVGDCASGADPVFDARYSPDVFLVRLRSAGIELSDLPTHFDNLMPPDRRRHSSLPGGCPAPDALARYCPGRELIELTDEDLAAELAQQLLAHDAVLLDVAPGVGCACAGVRRSGSPRTARLAVMSLEPPRAAHPVIESASLIDVSDSSAASMELALLARDPAADAVQADLSQPAFAPFEDVQGATIATGGEDDMARMSLPFAPVRSHARPRFAITPPRALEAVRSVTPTARRATSVGTESTLLVIDQLAPRDTPQAALLPEGSADLKPAQAERPPEPQVITEDSQPPSHRQAPARIRTPVRSAPPRPPRHDIMRHVLLWSSVTVAAVLLALAIVARTR